MTEEVQLEPVWNASLWPLCADFSMNMTCRLVESVIWSDRTLSFSSVTSPIQHLQFLCFFFSFSYWTSELHNWWIRQGKPIYSRVGRGSYKTNKRTTTKPNPNSKKLPHQRVMWTSVRCFIGTGEICRQPYFKWVRTSRGLTCFCSLFWSLGLTLLCSPWR